MDHYKQEQIVEGQTLTIAVPKSMDISRQCQVDIYETLNRATASDQFGSRAIINEPGVLKKGLLFIKGKFYCKKYLMLEVTMVSQLIFTYKHLKF